MKNLIFVLIIALGATGFAAESANTTKFILQWDSQKLPVAVELSRAYDPNVSRICEQGILDANIKLPGNYLIADQTVGLAPGESAVLILKITNKSKKNLTFSVAPHSTEPGESAIGFFFNCLCNGHIYKVGPEQTWYRIMKLNYRKSPIPNSSVVLKHVIFETNSEQKPKKHNH